MSTTTTLNAIREHSPCEDGWETLLKSLGKTEADDEPLPLTHILKSNGIKHAIWVLRCLPEDHKPQIVRFAADCAEHVLHLWETRYPKDLRPREAINAARKWADEPTEENRQAAADAARAADTAADAARAAVWSAAAAAALAANAAWVADVNAAWAATAAAHARAAAAIANEESKHQAGLFLKYFGDNEKPRLTLK